MPKSPKSRFGKAFPDELKKVASSSGHFHAPREDSAWQESLLTGGLGQTPTSLTGDWHKLFLISLMVIVFAVLFVRLFHLQLVEGAGNRELADSNRIQVRLIHAPRGIIYDRNGHILAQNEPGFRLVTTLATGTKVDLLSRDQAVQMEVRNDKRFKDLELDHLRSYPLGERAAHILGYIGEISQEELARASFKGYSLGDKIGRDGVEQIYEKVLRGTDGGEIVEVDAASRAVRTLRSTEAIPGKNLYLSIDADLQSYTFDLLSNTLLKVGSCCGTAIVQDPQTGQVLTLVSLPSFNPSQVEKFLTAASSPILNRAIAGVYPPGSTFKIVSSLAGLASGKITSTTQFEDTGVVSLGAFQFANWYFTQYGKTEGMVDLTKALKRSNDTYFYRLGLLTGEKPLAQTASSLGLGKKLGIDLPGEETGLVPNYDWKVEHIGQVWFPGDTLHMAIGQGFVLTTPVQINQLISTIASGGKQYPPHVAAKITNSSGKVIKEFNFEGVSNKLNSEYVKQVAAGLAEVTQDGGTAWPFFNFAIPTAGKTGTAEYGDFRGRTHAWYTSYGPVGDPKLAVTILIEEGGEGSTVAAPVAKEIYRWYFSPDKKNLIKDIYPIEASASARTLGE